ncbi:MAG: DUF4215 domain-containing protein [Candidatus Aminicenantia bacterium]
MKKRYKQFIIWGIILILGLVLISPSFLFFNEVKADQAQTTVLVTVCGNGEIDEDEFCDDGADNGRYAYNANDRYCNSTCSGWAPYCGDGIVQSEYGEECDDGNNESDDGCDAVCKDEGPTIPTGGGGVPPPVKTKVVIKGKAYPEAKINLLYDGKIAATQKADSLADFQIEIADITPGIWTFSLWAEDKGGRRSITFSFTVNVIHGVITTISGIFLPPTIELSKVKIQKGEVLDIYGQTAPESEVSTHIESPELISKTKAGRQGDWLQDFNTGILDEGMHTSRAKAISPEGLASSFSQVLAFYVGEVAPGVVCPNADFNEDGRVNLVDFSILLHWWGRFNSCVDQKQDGTVGLPDFSIMLYYWTG